MSAAGPARRRARAGGRVPGRRRRRRPAAAGPSAATDASWASNRSTRLCGTSRLTTAMVGSGSRGARSVGAAIVAVGHDVDRAAETEPAAQLVPGRGRDRGDGRGPVDRAGAAALEEAAERGEQRAEARGELVLVHVVHHLHDRHSARGRTAGRRTGCRSGSRRRRRSARADAAAQRGPRVERERAAGADDLDAVDDLATGLPGRAGRQPRHPGAARDPSPRDLVHVLLGASGLRMADVAPVEDRRHPGAARGQPVDCCGHSDRSRVGSGPPGSSRRRRGRGWKVEPAPSVQATGISAMRPPSRWTCASSSTSKAKPLVRTWASARLHRVAAEELETALRVGDPGTSERVSRRKAVPPAGRPAAARTHEARAGGVARRDRPPPRP